MTVERCPNCRKQMMSFEDKDTKGISRFAGRSLCYNCGKGCFEYNITLVLHDDEGAEYSRCCHCGITGNVLVETGK
ncbi:MAG: hypothetical protein M0024_10480 [Nitrospiraceae bacterium]|nr:hypothetical protein [Nitrospiraceae bacterium]